MFSYIFKTMLDDFFFFFVFYCLFLFRTILNCESCWSFFIAPLQVIQDRLPKTHNFRLFGRGIP